MSRKNLQTKMVIRAVKEKLQLSDLRTTKEGYGAFYLDGKKQFTVKLPNIHGGKNPSLSPDFQRAIRNRLRLTQPQFYDLVHCPMTQGDYEDLIRAKLRGEG